MIFNLTFLKGANERRKSGEIALPYFMWRKMSVVKLSVTLELI